MRTCHFIVQNLVLCVPHLQREVKMEMLGVDPEAQEKLDLSKKVAAQQKHIKSLIKTAESYMASLATSAHASDLLREVGHMVSQLQGELAAVPDNLEELRRKHEIFTQIVDAFSQSQQWKDLKALGKTRK